MAQRDEPSIACDVESARIGDGTDDYFAAMPLEGLVAFLPSYSDRRRILARDPLASIDGFRTRMQLAYTCRFGMRVCRACPDCNNGVNSTPCQDICDSSATATGGIFGRVDAIYTSTETQTPKGSLHTHSQVFVQCLHQHTPMAQVLAKLRQGGVAVVQGFRS